MMDFITIPLVVGMITLGIYRLFELFVKKKERLLLIEKLNVQPQEELFPNPISLGFNSHLPKGALKAGCLLLGLGLGLLVGFLITYNMIPDYLTNGKTNWHLRQMVGIIYGASVFIFGGLSLLLAFIIEIKLSKSNDNK